MGVAQAIRSGVIQHFEFTFELCWKFMQRWLRENSIPMTSHTYDLDQAAVVYDTAIEFAAAAADFSRRLADRND